MPQRSYLISVTTSQKNVEVTLGVMNIAGRGQVFHGFANGTICTDLWIIPKGKSNQNEVLAQLQTLPAIRSAAVVALSNPVRSEELTEVRELFAQVGWDASAVTNEALSLFLNAKLKRRFTYYIDYDHRKRGPVKIQIKPIENHPHFSPEWLNVTPYNEEEDPEPELTIDDIHITSVKLKTIKHEPPPPHPTNKNLSP